MNILPVGITAIGAYAPPDILTNQDLEKIVETSDEWIVTRTGISHRHIVAPDVATSDVAYQAALIALERAQLNPADLDCIVVTTITPDYPLPSTACLVQHRLGAVNAAAFDLAAACTGFVYGLAIASAPVALGQFRNALVIGVDCLSRVTDYTDRGTCVLLGDGGGAVVLQPVPEGRGILASYLRADGSRPEVLCIPAGGSRHPASAETVAAREHYLRMNGNEIFRFAVRAIEESVNAVLDQAGLSVQDVKLVVPHQANIRIIDAAAKRLAIPDSLWVKDVITEYGNTSAGTIPLALNAAYEAGRVQPGDLVILVGFGGGLTWGATALRW